MVEAAGGLTALTVSEARNHAVTRPWTPANALTGIFLQCEVSVQNASLQNVQYHFTVLVAL